MYFHALQVQIYENIQTILEQIGNFSQKLLIPYKMLMIH